MKRNVLNFRNTVLFRCLALVLTVMTCMACIPSQVFAAGEQTVTIRVCSWEEYIDLGDWDEEELIELESDEIIGIRPMVDEFEEWYYETYGIRVKVDYSTFGTNEDLYNMLKIGDVYDLVCPSEYMVMKLMAEEKLVPLSDAFFDEEDENNYYSRMVSPFIKEIFDEQKINGESWSRYMAGYMWGITGILYNPEEVTREEASSWKILTDPKFRRRITLKDNVRDSYFAALGALKADLLTSEEFRNDPEYPRRLEEEMNDISPETIAEVEEFLKEAKDNAYSFETESGKADMITGKAVANLQWSGDGVYTIDQAEEEDFELEFTVPEEATNIYFDGWVMLKSGVEGHSDRQHACEAFINYISRPDNVIRNMYYVGYTSVIAGNEEDTRIFEYADWSFGAEEDEEDTIDYNVGYFFSGDEEDEDYVITASSEQLYKQLFSQYPDAGALARSSIMVCFDDAANERINQMWINIRCMSIEDVPPGIWAVILMIWVSRSAFFSSSCCLVSVTSEMSFLS